MTDRAKIEADTLRRLAYFLHAQEVIGAQYANDHTSEEAQWWDVNVQSPGRDMFYTDSLYEAWAWLHAAANDIESGAWTLPERFYEDEPEYD